MGTLPPDVEATVCAHVDRCPGCRALLEALDDPEIASPTPEEIGRIRAQVAAGNQSHHWLWGWPAAVAALLVAGVAFALLWQLRSPTATAPSTAQLEKPGLPTRTDRGFVWRGGETEAADLSRALEPYDANDFAEAARGLAAFLERHPQSALGHFYLGASRLLLGAGRDAVAPLETAERLAQPDPVLTREIAWYLALAYRRTNQREGAAARLTMLCGADGPRRAAACVALGELQAESARPKRP